MRSLPRQLMIGVLAVMLGFAGCAGILREAPGEPAISESTWSAQSPLPSPGTALPDQPQASEPVPTPSLRGVTITTTEHLDETIAAVAALEPEPTVRIVVDPGGTPEDYRVLIEGLQPHAQIMLTLFDSTSLASASVDAVRQRSQDFVTAFADQVAIWEIGNELNGSWVGSNPAEINAKLLETSRQVERAGEASAITLNYWATPDCYTHPWEETASYARTLPVEVSASVDYLFLSVYETACEPAQRPSAADLGAMLGDIGEVAPQAWLGIGEIGVQGVEDGVEGASQVDKETIARRYMQMSDELHQLLGPRFVDGWFWWYFAEDAVPMDAPDSLWPVLNEELADI